MQGADRPYVLRSPPRIFQGVHRSLVAVSIRNGQTRTTMKITTTAIVALTAIFVGGCSASRGLPAVRSVPDSPAPSTFAAAAVPAAAHGTEASIESIPWSQVGPGWMLATWSPVSGTRPGEDQPPNEPTRDAAATTLYLVDPAGGRYLITTFAPPGDKGGPEMVDWSGDGSKA